MQELPITVEQFHQSRWGKLKDRVVKKIDHKIVKGEVKATSFGVVSEKKKPEVKKITPLKKSAAHSSGRPIEQVLVGSWNAIKQIPEKQGKGVVNLYDKLRFPKLTTEEQKVNDKVHVFLKKYQKEIGWGVTGVEAAAVTYGVVKGFQYLKERSLQKKALKERTNLVQSESTLNIVVPAAAVEVVLSVEQKALQALMDKVRSPDFFAQEFLSPDDLDILGKCYFSPGLRQQIQEGMLVRFVGRLQDLDKTTSSFAKDSLRRYTLDSAMNKAVADFAVANKGWVMEEALAQKVENPHVIVDILEYARVVRHMFEKHGYFDIGGFEGRNIESLLDAPKPRRRRRITP